MHTLMHSISVIAETFERKEGILHLNIIFNFNKFSKLHIDHKNIQN